MAPLAKHSLPKTSLAKGALFPYIRAPFRHLRQKISLLHIITVTFCLLVLLPIGVVFLGWQQVVLTQWQHLFDTIFLELIINTLILLFGVGSGVVILGVGLGYMVANIEFPGRRFFEWALILPLAIPPYVLAFVSLGIFDFAGPVQTALREVLGWGLPDFLQIRSTGGVIFVLTLAFYPYVYLLSRAAFYTQGDALVDAARSLGVPRQRYFFTLSLPMARPAIVAGTTLALMETLADFGAVSVFNFDTFTTAIYKMGIGLFDFYTAAQLASILLLFVALAVILEKRSRRKLHCETKVSEKKCRRLKLPRRTQLVIMAICLFVLCFGFIFPMAQLLIWVVTGVSEHFNERFIELLINTITIATLAALVTCGVSLIIAYAKRVHRSSILICYAVFIASLGYAIPGTVLAIGLMWCFVWLNAEWLWITGSESTSSILVGSILGLIIAYLIRFFAIAFGPMSSSLDAITPVYAECAKSLGANHFAVVTRVYLPMLTPGILTAVLMVFVEVMKEMPATLLMRPFGWDTLAVRIYELTSEGEWERAALPAFAIVVIGLVPVYFLTKQSRRAKIDN